MIKVGAKDPMYLGDRIFLPKSVNVKCPSTRVITRSSGDEKELEYVRGLELYKV